MPICPPDAAVNSRCPRCGAGFCCGVDTGKACACGTVEASEQTLTELRARYTACLCLPCLRAVAAGAPADPVPGRTPAG